MTDSTRPNTTKMIRAPKPPTAEEQRNKYGHYPKQLYHSGGSYRVVWGPEEHAEAKSEGWTDSPEEGKKYVTWTAVLPPEDEDNDVPGSGEADRAKAAIDSVVNDSLRFKSQEA